MDCPVCKRRMVELFISKACDHCDYSPNTDRMYRGYIVFNPAWEKGDEAYVFRNTVDAERWRTAAGREGHVIRTVFSMAPFKWHLSRGTLRDVVLADHMFEIFPDHRYEPLPHRAFLAGDNA